MRGTEAAAAYAFLTDQILRLAYDYVTLQLHPRGNATTSERLLMLGGRRLWPRRDGAPFGRRHRLRDAVEADRLDRERDRGDPLSALGSRPHRRPLHAQRRRGDPRDVGRPDDPHRIARGTLRLGRRGAVRRGRDALLEGRRRRHRSPASSRRSSTSARRGTRGWATAATSSSPTSRRAKAGCATSTRCSGSANMPIGCAT